MNTDKVIQKASFNPLIKTYILLIGSLILLATVIGILLIPIWLIWPGRYFARRYFDSLECELTDRSLRFSKGVLITVEKTIPLENIQDLTFVEGPILKTFDLCILKIETAGNSSSSNSDMKLLGIKNAGSFRDMVMEQRKTLADRPSNDSGSNQNMLNKLDEIKDVLVRIEKNLAPPQ